MGPNSSLTYDEPAPVTAGSVPIPRSSRPGLAVLVRLAGPVLAAAVAFVASMPHGRPLLNAGLVLITLLGVRALGRRQPRSVQMLPLMGRLARLLTLVGGAIAIGALHAAGGVPGISTAYVALIALIAVIVDAGAEQIARRLEPTPPTRIAIIGPANVAESLDRELRMAGLSGRFEVVGRIIGPHEPCSDTDEVPVIGRRGELAELAVRHDLLLLLISSKVPRLEVFEEVGRSCLHLMVRVHELSSFYERVFGHVASAEINATWFQYILHPDYRTGSSRSERALDLVLSGIVAVGAIPLLGLFAYMVRRDGGPAFFRQVRIGEGGHPFTIFKLRTMRVEDAGTAWAAEGDARVTPIGRFLRRTHLDELPQLLNVVRGEMSIVGPRPEQPQIVDELELLMPFYQRRHLMKPGVTGWAQVRCGYAGSHTGSAWKLCHDLYYLKHRSLWLNMLIVAETVRTLVADRQYTARSVSIDFILAPTDPVGEKSFSLVVEPAQA